MKKTKKLFILRGLPASGKSSWAMNYVNEHPKTSIILSKDGIRDMLGIYWVNEREPLVSRIFILLLKDIVTHGSFTFSKDSSWNAVDENMDNVYDIIIDNTNLNSAAVNEIMDMVAPYDYEIKEVIFNTPMKTCIERDSMRKRNVGSKVIEGFYRTYISADGKMKDIVPVTVNPLIVSVCDRISSDENVFKGCNELGTTVSVMSSLKEDLLKSVYKWVATNQDGLVKVFEKEPYEMEVHGNDIYDAFPLHVWMKSEGRTEILMYPEKFLKYIPMQREKIRLEKNNLKDLSEIEF